MDDFDPLIHEELERLAAAHLAMDAADETFETATAGEQSSAPTAPKPGLPTSSEDLDLPSSFVSSLLSAQRALLTQDNNPNEQTALVSLPPWITLEEGAEYLFKLQPPFETTAKLEDNFGLPSGSVNGIKGDRLGNDVDDKEDEEEVEFVFISSAGKEKIGKWYAAAGQEAGKYERPLFVKLAKTGFMRRGPS